MFFVATVGSLSRFGREGEKTQIYKGGMIKKKIKWLATPVLESNSKCMKDGREMWERKKVKNRFYPHKISHSWCLKLRRGYWLPTFLLCSNCVKKH